MKTLIVYDSKFGNTEKLAISMAGKLRGKAVHVEKFELKMLKGIKERAEKSRKTTGE